MAKKAKFHHIKLHTGHGSEERIIPANQQHDVKKELENSAVRVEFIDSTLWKETEVIVDGTNSAFFLTEDEIQIHKGQIGFEYLCKQFQKEYDSAIKASVPDDID